MFRSFAFPIPEVTDVTVQAEQILASSFMS